MAKVLLVDDDQDILVLGGALLRSVGHEVLLAPTALDALQVLRASDIDLLITDANMPSHSGFELIKACKQIPKTKNIVIAMLTGRRERSDIEKAMALGVNDYIVKPLDPALFLHKIGQMAALHGLASPAPSGELEASPAQITAATHTKEVAGEPPFATTIIKESAQASVEVEIYSLSEVGWLIRSPTAFSEGSRVLIGTAIFEKIGITPPLMKVVSSVQVSDGYETRVDFIGANEATLSRIRAWVHANSLRHHRGAA